MHKKVKLGDKPGIIVTYDRETNILSVCLRDLYSSFPLSRVCVRVCVCVLGNEGDGHFEAPWQGYNKILSSFFAE